MKERKPACTAFIVEAIRVIRPRNRKMKPRIASGVSLRKVFFVTTTIYPAAEFVQALDELLREGTVLLSTRMCTWSKDEDNICRYLSREIIRLMKAPPKNQCAQSEWRKDEHGKPLEPSDTAKTGRDYRDIRLHVVADGLPARIAQLVTGHLSKGNAAVGATAAKILERLREKQ